MENLNETIQFLIQSLQTYTGNNPIWILYPVALILIWFLGKKGDRKLFIGVFVTECLTIFNQFVLKFLLDLDLEHVLSDFCGSLSSLLQ